MTKDEALTLALEAMLNFPDDISDEMFEAITAIKEALAQTQEPVTWPCLIDSADFSENTITLVMQCEDYKVSAGTHYLSTIPPQRTWAGLTDEETTKVIKSMPRGINGWMSDWDLYEFSKAIEAKLKEKNT